MARIANAAPVVAPAVDTKVAASASEPAETLSAQLAAKAPVDAERVQRIKQAIANGTFPISPATIADQLIALKYEWMSHDAS